MSSERKNVLVTGGAGFIGSHLCDWLIKEANVICVDNFINGSAANIEHLLREPHFEFINHDITQPLDLKRYRELEHFDVSVRGIHEIYHLAGPVSQRYFDDFKIAAALTDSIGLKYILDLAVADRAKVLYASSGVLYGARRDGEPIKETDECRLDHLTARGAYEEGKRFSEAMLQTYAEVYGLDVKIARLFATYGPRMKAFDGNLIPDMILNALDNKDMVIAGDEEAGTSLCHIKDIVEGLIKLMASPLDITLMNLGSDQAIRLVSIAQKILNLTGSASRVRFDHRVSDQIVLGLPDITRAKDLLGWVPLVRLDDGLKQVVDYVNSHKSQIIY